MEEHQTSLKQGYGSRLLEDVVRHDENVDKIKKLE